VTYYDLIGLPFENGTRGPDKFDCYGLVKFLIERDTGQRVPDYESPEDSGRVHALMTCSILFWNQLPGPRVGSMVMFRLGREVCHVGYVISNDRFIHAWEKTGGVTTERLADWDKRIVGFYEYIEEAK
jgi:cell wall-associated NlpC family hydrolase